MFHVRADMADDGALRLARAFETNLILDGPGSDGTLRREATDAGIPTVTLEMGEAHRFERELIDHALEGVRSVFAKYGVHRPETVRCPGWRTVIDGWIRTRCSVPTMVGSSRCVTNAALSSRRERPSVE